MTGYYINQEACCLFCKIKNRVTEMPDSVFVSEVAKKAELLHKIWKRVRSPFLFPRKICKHDELWEVFDAGVAGCRMCGTPHICAYGKCKTLLNSENEEVCVITGLINIENLNLTYKEHVETVHYNTPKHLVSIDSKANLRCQTRTIDYFIKTLPIQLLCSPSWNECKNTEISRYAQKVTEILYKDLKLYKESNLDTIPVISELAAVSIRKIGMLEQPTVAEYEVRAKLCEWCSEIITKHVHQILKLGSSLSLNISKIRGTIIGLIYLCRTGIIFKGIVVLPRNDLLARLLPMEIYLQSTYEVKSKVITEIENDMKRRLRAMSNNELVSNFQTS